jgi:hypothetical protein
VRVGVAVHAGLHGVWLGVDVRVDVGVHEGLHGVGVSVRVKVDVGVSVNHVPVGVDVVVRVGVRVRVGVGVHDGEQGVWLGVTVRELVGVLVGVSVSSMACSGCLAPGRICIGCETPTAAIEVVPICGCVGFAANATLTDSARHKTVIMNRVYSHLFRRLLIVIAHPFSR